MTKRATSLRFSDMSAGTSSVNTPAPFKPRNIIQRVSSEIVSLPTPVNYTLSAHQQDIIDFSLSGSGSALVSAVAGSGKTFIILEVCKALGRGPSIALMAYNKAIATEIQTKIEALSLPNVRVGTCHSFGLSTIRAIHRAVRIDQPGKTRKMIADIKAPVTISRAVGRLVSLAKQSAVGVLWQTSDIARWEETIDRFDIALDVQGNGGFKDEVELRRALIDYAINGLAFAQESSNYIIDFDDMLWVPLIEEMQSTTYDWVIGDEVQDFNAARRLAAQRMMKPISGRALFAGDRNQAIYGFSGADAEGVDILLDQFNAAELPLTTTYRCSKAATALAQEFVPQIEAGADNRAGAVHNIDEDKLDAMVASGTVGGGDAILCRLTKPLVKLCLRLIAQGVPAFVEGRNIGQSLEALARKWDVQSIGALVTCLENYRLSESRRLLEQGADYAIEGLNDKLDALLAIMHECDDVAGVRAKITRLFDDTPAGSNERRIVLSTIHKAKGREWERVFILGWGKYMPSRRAKQEWQKQAETNLQYVAVTRTKNELYLIHVGDRDRG